MKASIVVPVYNIEENLIHRCMKSILAQTERDMEIILVDDGSTNNSLQVCRSYENLPNVTVIHQENSGVSIARNTGMDRAKGKWIMFVDPDDYLEKNALEELLKNATEEDDVVSCCCITDNNGKRTANSFYDGSRNFCGKKKEELFKNLLYRIKMIGTPWGKIYRLDFLRRNNIRFFIELVRSQDIVFNLYVLQHSRNFKYIDIPLYDYNIDHGASYHKDYRARLIAFYLIFANGRYEFMNKFNLNENPVLREFFYGGACALLIQILEIGAFHPKNKIPFTRRKQMAMTVRNMECFDIIDEMKKCRHIRMQKNERMKNFLLKKKWFRILYMFMKIEDKHKFLNFDEISA